MRKLLTLSLVTILVTLIYTMSNQQQKLVVVVGTGLAGLTTTHQLLNKGAQVVLLEKTAVVGFKSNSNKASSGINGAPTEQQAALQIQDSVEKFVLDATRSARDAARPDLIAELCSRSKLAIDWLTKSFEIDLSKVSQLGGHSVARTHRGSGSLPPGYAIVSTLVKSLERYEQNQQLQILKNSQIVRLLVENQAVVGVEYQDLNTNPPKLKQILSKHVVLATGGYSADFESPSSLLKKYRPDVLKMSSTNGQQTTGDGVKVLQEAGLQLVDMDKVQIHPTGFVDLQDPDNKWKFLAGELLRGSGGVLLNHLGARFVDELQTRDKVTEAIFETSKETGHENDNQVFLVLTEDSYNACKSHVDFYLSKSLMFKTSLGLFEEKHGIKTSSGLAIESSDTIYYGVVTPVVHFSMGGVKIDRSARVLGLKDEPIEGLYAVGEVSGGVHGFNRLGGSSLLECVVFGTILSETITGGSK